MKQSFIRTKDTIFAVVSENDKVFIVRAKGNPNHLYNKSKVNTEVLGQADTIEELCDELVLKDLDAEMCFVMNAVHIQDIKENWKNLKDNDYFKNHTIYGAIWTDKGLIYAAKMNEKGELELL